MKKTDLIKRPSWILEKPRKFNKLWLDKNENTHPKLLNLYKKILYAKKKSKLYTIENHSKMINRYLN